MWVAPTGEKIWKKSTDRDLSFVFYLNDGFEGGDFVFPEHHIRVRPKPDMLITFPSNHFYMHGVEPVTKGKKIFNCNMGKGQGFSFTWNKQTENSLKNMEFLSYK